MELSLIHAGLAAGTALAALPVILHLFMRQTPKHVIFPALRLIRERQKRSRKRLKVKNWLLLLARMALLALMALALARPRLFSQTPLGDQSVPSALGFVFDTSLSMGYKDKDKTRLDAAKEQAEEILRKTPDTSQVYVVDSSIPGVPRPLSPAAARKQIEGLTLRASNRPLNGAVGQAYAAVVDSDRPRREVYVLTDLARSAWDPARPVENLDKVVKAKKGAPKPDAPAKAKAKGSDAEIMTYVLRLTPKEATDVAVVEAEPTSATVAPGEPVEVRAKLRSKGPATSRIVEFLLDHRPRGKETVNIPANGEVEVRFKGPKLAADTPLHQGEVRISGTPDPLSFDDVRYFTFRVQPLIKILLVSDRAIDAVFVKDALDPDPATLPPGTPRTYQADTIRTDKFLGQPKEALKDYAAVFLLNAEALTPDAWGRLNSFVRDGGGLVVGAGDLANPENYNGDAAAPLLPAALGKAARSKTTFGKVTDVTNPLFDKYKQELDAVLNKIPVFKHWTVTPSGGSRTLLAFADNAPALLERTFRGPKTGRVLLWTTPLSRRVDPESPQAWNEFPNPDYWPFVAIMLNTVPYLTGSEGEALNYEAGRDVVLPLAPGRRFRNYTVQHLGSKTSERTSPQSTGDSLVIVGPQQMGQWKVTAESADEAQKGPLALGFSVNAPLKESQLTPLETADLNALFEGKDHYRLADDPQGLERATVLDRVGYEVFPWLMALILMLVTAENLLANRFYREAGGQASPTRAAAAVAAPT